MFDAASLGRDLSDIGASEEAWSAPGFVDCEGSLPQFCRGQLFSGPCRIIAERRMRAVISQVREL